MGDLLDHLGRACKQARRDAGLYQIDIANSAGISTSPISRLESGERLPEGLEEVINAYASECRLQPIDLWERAIIAWRADTS